MLNDQRLSEILEVKLPTLKVKDIHWKTQDSDEFSLLFYKILPGEKASEAFTQRISSSHFAWLITNVDHPDRPLNSSVIDEEHWSEIQKKVLDELYPLPDLKLIAVTGTNGKTTTADLVLQLGTQLGKKGLSIGTLGVRENQKTLLDFGMTSPSFIDLRKFLSQHGRDKDFCVLEASSHALVQNRLYGLTFDAAGWLSFSQDHLDYHSTMEEYFSAKLLIFSHLKKEAHLFVPSGQDELFKKIHQVQKNLLKAPVIETKLPLFFSTAFNRSNLEVAQALINDIFPGPNTVNFDQLIPPDGRFFIRPYLTNYIVVDFAHTPDALENICRGIREAFPEYELIVLFGCGGDRDRTKRPLMGKIAESYAHKIYVTSDNPRTEDPDLIIDDITAGMTSGNIQRMTQRPEAVQRAMSELTEKQVLLLAGKGHENYILINGTKHHYSDIEEVEKFLKGKNV